MERGGSKEGGILLGINYCSLNWESAAICMLLHSNEQIVFDRNCAKLCPVVELGLTGYVSGSGRMARYCGFRFMEKSLRLMSNYGFQLG